MTAFATTPASALELFLDTIHCRRRAAVVYSVVLKFKKCLAAEVRNALRPRCAKIRVEELVQMQTISCPEA